jgi:hypothetical protein
VRLGSEWRDPPLASPRGKGRDRVRALADHDAYHDPVDLFTTSRRWTNAELEEFDAVGVDVAHAGVYAFRDGVAEVGDPFGVGQRAADLLGLYGVSASSRPATGAGRP